jgi:hypothetical protein
MMFLGKRARAMAAVGSYSPSDLIYWSKLARNVSRFIENPFLAENGHENIARTVMAELEMDPHELAIMQEIVQTLAAVLQALQSDDADYVAIMERVTQVWNTHQEILRYWKERIDAFCWEDDQRALLDALSELVDQAQYAMQVLKITG